MWQIIFDKAVLIIAVVLCAIAVKLVDDFLDKDQDHRAASPNLATRLGNGTVIYAMLIFTLAASLNAPVAIPLFLASYGIGMFTDWKQPFPSGLSGLQESLLVFVLGILFYGWQRMLFSIFFICAVQLFDDYMDVYRDELVGYRNIAYRIGNVECFLLGLIALLSSWQLEEHMFPFVFLGTLIFYLLLFFYQKGEY